MLNKYEVGVDEATYFAKSASQPVIARRTPASVSYFPVRTKSFGLLGQLRSRKCRVSTNSHMIARDGSNARKMPGCFVTL